MCCVHISLYRQARPSPARLTTNWLTGCCCFTLRTTTATSSQPLVAPFSDGGLETSGGGNGEGPRPGTTESLLDADEEKWEEIGGGDEAVTGGKVCMLLLSSGNL